MTFRVAAAVLLAGCVSFGAPQPPPAAAVIEAAIDKEGLAAARARMDDIEAHVDAYAISERDINALGYRYMGRGALAEAIAVFEFNVRRFPASSNVYDSLAEASVIAGDDGRIEATLKTWQARFPGSDAVTGRVAALRELAVRAREERRQAYRLGQPTGLQGPYLGQPEPGMTPVLFAPGIVSLAFTREGFGTMSPDGKTFFFEARGRTPDLKVAPPAGLARFGAEAPAVMVTRLGPEGWTFPEPAAFTAGFAAREPHASPKDGRLYWEWFRALPGDEPDPQKIGTGIWTSRPTASGWSEPEFVGQGMAITSTRTGEVFVTDLSEITKGNGYIATARMKDGRFAAFERLQGGPEVLRSEKVRNVAHPAISPDGSYLLFDKGGPPSYVCFRRPDSDWGDPIDLSQHGLDATTAVTSVSPDGRYLFLAKAGDVYWVSSRVVESLRPPGH